MIQEFRVFVCDVCGATHQRSSGSCDLPAGWLAVRASVDLYGQDGSFSTESSRAHACGPKCARRLLSKPLKIGERDAKQEG